MQRNGINNMAAIDEAIKAVVDAVDALEALDTAPTAPAEVVDSVRKAVEDVLTAEGWTAPVAPEVETPAEDTGEAVEEPA